LVDRLQFKLRFFDELDSCCMSIRALPRHETDLALDTSSL